MRQRWDWGSSCTCGSLGLVEQGGSGLGGRPLGAAAAEASRGRRARRSEHWKGRQTHLLILVLLLLVLLLAWLLLRRLLVGEPWPPLLVWLPLLLLKRRRSRA